METIAPVLPLVILASLGLLGMVVYRRWASAKVDRTAAQNPSGVTLSASPAGFGGWLLLLVIGQTGAPLLSLREIVATLGELQTALASPEATVIVGISLLVQVSFMIFQVIVTVFMYLRSRLFPRLFQYQWFIGVGILFASALMIVAVLSPTGSPADTKWLKDAMRDAIWGGVWVLYVYKSVRVKNTFVR